MDACSTILISFAFENEETLTDIHFSLEKGKPWAWLVRQALEKRP